jgi:hypothetical protein
MCYLEKEVKELRRANEILTVPKTRSRLSTPGEQEVMAGASDRFAAWARLAEMLQGEAGKGGTHTVSPCYAESILTEDSENTEFPGQRPSQK